jgi:hypothetical protein
MVKQEIHHVDIFKSHTDYLGFSWCYGNTVNYLKFLVLPFGLSSACYIFTKLTRPYCLKYFQKSFLWDIDQKFFCIDKIAQNR